MLSDGQPELALTQHEHWQDTYRAHPAMYGSDPSEPALYSADVFAAEGVERILELAAGHGRDTLYFAHRGFTVAATDFSEVAVAQLRQTARAQGIAARVEATVHDLRNPLPQLSGSIDGAFAHMALCMALSTKEIHAVVDEVGRVLKPGGKFIYTVRHTGDAHYGAGRAHGDDIFEYGGFAVHFFCRELVESLTAGWILEDVHAFDEGELPRRLWRVTATKPG
ncbi:6-O-methylguanine DNA methyltransferase [Mycobacterium haemophilum]|uniref:6-O-methylguanine DNA methyltransferase n=2 Tax=Mycobacterium haemophilum TaxID=29311 RepID=A0A0I9ZT06_9MYCO|nr:6-O-methylguanine DNA methyltransferase [Mycobacterium haemophilum]KLO38940.1 6-O-methylguanine DNA methyltransferase [Mycobacterium haemophilum]KLO45357.1 6-O-methylguanine DNA methyltransferase [Mycobacterium haemophilum]KLO56507.1 6-O-methylguanine DNA methyltransferase [Mycobacterium haemophilum]